MTFLSLLRATLSPPKVCGRDLGGVWVGVGWWVRDGLGVAAMTQGSESLLATLIADPPDGLYTYWCPICKVGTGDRSWHSLRDGGLFPQNDTEHDCVRIDVTALLGVVAAAGQFRSVFFVDDHEYGLRARETYEAIRALDLALERIRA